MMNRYTIAALGPLLFLTVAAYAANNSRSKVHEWQDSGANQIPNPANINGSSGKLTRGDGLIWLRLNTTQLPAGAYTNWWVVFNNPGACGAVCNGADFPQNGGDPDVGASVLFATGGVVGANGVGHFRAHLEENNAPGQVLFGPGLTDAEGAEVHIIIRYHGPAMPHILDEQTQTFGGGCDIFNCYDPQATGFPRP